MSETRHKCKTDFDGLCEEDEHGFLWAGNTIDLLAVNFCPFCGYKAKRPIVEQDGFHGITEDTLAEPLK